MSLAVYMKLKLVLLFIVAAAALHAQTPEWIWFDAKDSAPESEEVRYFRKLFEAPRDFTKAVLTASGDDRVTVFLNGKQVAENRNWKNAVSINLTKDVKAGSNVLALRGRNNNGTAAVIARLEFTLKDGSKQSVVTDPSWSAAPAAVDGWQDMAATAQAWFKPVS